MPTHIYKIKLALGRRGVSALSERRDVSWSYGHAARILMGKYCVREHYISVRLQ